MNNLSENQKIFHAMVLREVLQNRVYTLEEKNSQLNEKLLYASSLIFSLEKRVNILKDRLEDKTKVIERSDSLKLNYDTIKEEVLDFQRNISKAEVNTYVHIHERKDYYHREKNETDLPLTLNKACNRKNLSNSHYSSPQESQNSSYLPDISRSKLSKRITRRNSLSSLREVFKKKSSNQFTTIDDRETHELEIAFHASCKLLKKNLQKENNKHDIESEKTVKTSNISSNNHVVTYTNAVMIGGRKIARRNSMSCIKEKVTNRFGNTVKIINDRQELHIIEKKNDSVAAIAGMERDGNINNVKDFDEGKRLSHKQSIREIFSSDASQKASELALGSDWEDINSGLVAQLQGRRIVGV